jgi:hypothetical protein
MTKGITAAKISGIAMQPEQLHAHMVDVRMMLFEHRGWCNVVIPATLARTRTLSTTRLPLRCGAGWISDDPHHIDSGHRMSMPRSLRGLQSDCYEHAPNTSYKLEIGEGGVLESACAHVHVVREIVVGLFD